MVSIPSTTEVGTLSNVMHMFIPPTEMLNAILAQIVSSYHDVSAIVTTTTSKPQSMIELKYSL